MFDWIFENILAKGKQEGWKQFIPLLVIFGIFILKNLGGLKFNKKEDDEQLDRIRQARKQPSGSTGNRYAPLDEDGRAVKRPSPTSRQDEPERQQLRRGSGEPIAPAQAKIMPEHDHTKEFAAVKRYQARQAALKKQMAAKQRLASQIRQKTKPKPAPKVVKARRPEPDRVEELEIIETASDISVDDFVANPQNLRTAFIMSEVLGKPIAMR